MEIILNQWVYIENQKWGRMFAAAEDRQDSDHMVETDITPQNSDKYKWMLYQDGANYYIQNKSYGFMFAASEDRKGEDHIVECDPDITTLKDVKRKAASSSKWLWKIEINGNAVSFFNGKYGIMFSAAEDRKDNDHIVETRPDKTYYGGKWEWRINGIWDTASWMKDSEDAISNKRLKDLVIPGTHDSATYGIKPTSTIAPKQDIPTWVNAVYTLGPTGLLVMEVIANWARTQEKTIKEQLEAGIRYFDLRVIRDGNEFYICHSLYSINIDKLISGIKDFINTHPKEIIILDFNHLYQMNNLSENVPLIEKLTEAFDNKMAPNSMSQNNKVEEFWNSNYQVITLYNNDDAVKKYSKLWSQDNISSPWPDINSINEIGKLKTFLSDKLSKKPSNKFFVSQGILTPSTGIISKGLVPGTNDPSSIKGLAEIVNPNVVDWLNEWKDKNMNIVIVDWFNCGNYVATIRQINMDKQ